MPEGPEIRRMAEQLQPYLLDKTLTAVDVLSGRYKRHSGTFKAPQTLPSRIIGVSSHGKTLFWTFEGGQYLIASMAMTGSWRLNEDPYNRVRFTFSDGSEVFFNDIRNFGTLRFCDGTEVSRKEKSLGLDLFGQDGGRYNSRPEEFLEYCKSFKGKLGKLLLDQSFLSGVGNYIRAEALYRAKLSPFRLLEELTDTEKLALWQAVFSVVNESYKAGGATILTYQGIDGGLGLYTEQFKVYGRKTDPLGNEVVRQVDDSKRAIWWVPKVQV